MMGRLDVSVVLPVSDEAPLVNSGIQALTRWLDRLSWELVIIDLGSIDGSAELLEPFSGAGNIKLVMEEEPLGKGYAHRLGALLSTGEWILLADLCRPMHAAPLREAFEGLSQADLWVWTPLAPRGCGSMWRDRMLAWSFRRRFMPSEAVQPHDPDGGVVLVRREVAMALFPLCTQAEQLYTYELLQLAAQEGHRLAELPIDARRWPRQPWRELLRKLRDVEAVRRGLSGRLDQ